MVEVVGFEPTTYSVQTSRSSQLELYPHIKQNTLRVNYLLSAETLLSWSAEPHHFPYGLVKLTLPPQTHYISFTASIKTNYIFCNYTEFPSYPKRVASSRSKADNQKTETSITLQPITMSFLHCYWKGA